METVFPCLSTSCCSHFQTCPILLLSCRETLARLTYTSTQHHSMTSCRTTQAVLERELPLISKQDLTWSLPIKSGSLQTSGCRVGCITAGQVCRKDWLHFTNSRLVGYGTCVYKRRVSMLIASLRFSTPTHDNW